MQEVADTLGVSRATVSRWMHDKGTPPKRAFIIQWALACGVDPDWLEHGTPATSTPPPGQGQPDLPDAVAKLAASKRATRRSTTQQYLSVGDLAA